MKMRGVVSYRTPRWLFDRNNDLYHFDLDAAASHENHLCGKYFTKSKGALTRRWYGRVWCNPPYSNIAPFVVKAYEESLRGAVVVMLLPAWVDYRWYTTHCLRFADIEFLSGRVKFETADGKSFSSYFASMICVFPKSKATKNAA